MSSTPPFASGGSTASQSTNNRVIVDTNIVSYMFRGDTRAALYRPDLAGKELGISFQTLAELRQWATIHKWGLRQRQARARMLGYYTLYLVDEPLIDAWATISARVAAKGRHIATGDAWIAATAWLAGVPLVSHNRKDFQHIDGLRLISYGDP